MRNVTGIVPTQLYRGQDVNLLNTPRTMRFDITVNFVYVNLLFRNWRNKGLYECNNQWHI